MVLEAAYCKLDAAKAEYAKLAKNTKQKAKEAKEKEETLDPGGKKKAREPKEQADILAPDIIANTPTLATAKKACEEAAKKVKEAKLAVTMTGAKPFELYRKLFSDKLGENHIGPSDTSALGGCLWNPTCQDSHQKLVFFLRLREVSSSNGVLL